MMARALPRAIFIRDPLDNPQQYTPADKVSDCYGNEVVPDFRSTGGDAKLGPECASFHQTDVDVKPDVAHRARI